MLQKQVQQGKNVTSATILSKLLLFLFYYDHNTQMIITELRVSSVVKNVQK